MLNLATVGIEGSLPVAFGSLFTRMCTCSSQTVFFLLFNLTYVYDVFFFLSDFIADFMWKVNNNNKCKVIN